MNVEDMFSTANDPVSRHLEQVRKKIDLELAYFILTMGDYDLENYDIRFIYGNVGFEIERTKRITPRTTQEVFEIRAMAVDVLRRNEK